MGLSPIQTSPLTPKIVGRKNPIHTSDKWLHISKNYQESGFENSLAGCELVPRTVLQLPPNPPDRRLENEQNMWGRWWVSGLMSDIPFCCTNIVIVSAWHCTFVLIYERFISVDDKCYLLCLYVTTTVCYVQSVTYSHPQEPRGWLEMYETCQQGEFTF